MGVLHGRDLLSTKYITAEIKDASKRLWYVPIKHTLGDYFLAEIDGQLYCFKIGEICKYREKLTRSFEKINYDTTHYLPINSKVKELELVLNKNNLPKVDGMLADIFRILGSKEKKPFKSHTLKEFQDELNKYSEKQSGKVLPTSQNKYAKQIESISNYLENLRIEEIVTPVRGVSEFIEEDLRATDPKFLGTVSKTLQELDYENKKVTNVPIKSSAAWMKMALVFMMVGLIGFVLYYGYEQGWFDTITDLTSSFEDVNISFAPPPNPDNKQSDVYWQSRYSPQELRSAVDRGEVNEDELPPNIKEMIRNVEVSAEPTP